MIPFGTNPWRMLIDLLTSRSTCRSTQVKIASTDLWPQGMFTFFEMLALGESESSFGAYVCHRRPGGSLATSDLVAWVRDGASGDGRSVTWIRMHSEQSETETRKTAFCSSETLKSYAGDWPTVTGCPVSKPGNNYANGQLVRILCRHTLCLYL